MIDAIRNAVREKIPSLTDAEIDKLIDENKKEIAIILGYSYLKDITKNYIEDGSKLSWAQGKKLEFDYCRSLQNDVEKRIISLCEMCHERSIESRDRTGANKFTKIIGDTVKSSGQVKQSIGLATDELQITIGEELDIQKESADTARIMRTE